jgi:hypothetical protein
MERNSALWPTGACRRDKGRPSFHARVEDLRGLFKSTGNARRPDYRDGADEGHGEGAAAGGGERGLIEPGARTPSKLNRVKFRPDPTPVMTATIVYYRP